jgi:hypothetical protein
MRPNCRNRFWGQTVATSFEVILEKTVATGFEAKLLETVTTGFEAKPVKTVQVVLRPNHSQTVDHGFEAQPRNTHSSFPRAWCRPHMTPPDLLTARPPSTRPVRPSLVLCIRSPTPTTILVAARHATPATCTPWDKQTWFSEWNKDKRKTKRTYLRFEFKPCQVNDSSQSNQGIDHLVSQEYLHVIGLHAGQETSGWKKQGIFSFSWDLGFWWMKDSAL